MSFRVRGVFGLRRGGGPGPPGLPVGEAREVLGSAFAGDGVDRFFGDLARVVSDPLEMTAGEQREGETFRREATRLEERDQPDLQLLVDAVDVVVHREDLL